MKHKSVTACTTQHQPRFAHTHPDRRARLAITMAEADDDQEETVPWDGKIVDNDQQHCPSDLIWVQKGDGTVLFNPDLLEGKGAAAKSRRSESPAGLPRMVNDVYVVPPLGKGVKMDVATKSFLVPARNSKGKLLGFNEGYGFPPPPPPLSQPAMGTLALRIQPHPHSHLLTLSPSLAPLPPRHRHGELDAGGWPHVCAPLQPRKGAPQMHPSLSNPPPPPPPHTHTPHSSRCCCHHTFTHSSY